MTDKGKAVAELRKAGLEAAEADSAVMVYLSQDSTKKEIDEMKGKAYAILTRIGYDASWGISTRIPKDLKPETQPEDAGTLEDEPDALAGSDIDTSKAGSNVAEADMGASDPDAGDAGSDAGEADSDAGETGSSAGDAGSDAGETGSSAGDAGSDAGETDSDAGKAGESPLGEATQMSLFDLL
ncbi:MAG: hypothetical protein K6F35_05950 [Lachnospiraceae bacterium]|nr:hypothetical protein [Lachnospiraceae bacterium]